MVSTNPASGTVKVAIDVGPLHGQRTGVGNAVAWTLDALADEPSVTLRPYVTSMRAKLQPSVRRLPIPAAVAHRWWKHRSPPLDLVLGRPDVVHGTNYVVPPARCARVVSVYDCWFLDNPDDAAPDVRRSGQVLRRAVSDGAVVVTSSDATADRVRDLLDTDRVRTIHLGPPPLDPPPLGPTPPVPPPLDTVMPRVDVTTPLAGPPLAVLPIADLPIERLTSQPFLLALGTIERRKNIPLLIDAFSRVANEHETAMLVVAGAPGDDSDAVGRAIARLDAATAERVVRTGPVDADSKRWLLDNASALAYPSLDEGFGFPILEAQQANLPVVASAAGSIPEVAGSAALLSPASDRDALAANLYWVLTGDEIRRKLIAQGRRNLERFSWANTSRQLADLYTLLVTEGIT